ncbi:MAG: hypothetical protein GXP25_21655 [Planctomycetes bacterium]|nr:hypothetical protein [Planctomycetota bacterium]
MARSMSAAFAALVCSLLIGSASFGQQVQEFRFGPEDGLRIQVWDHDDLTREVTLDRNGDFKFPLIGTVHAKGLTLNEVQKLLTEKLADGYIVNPQINVEIAAHRSRSITVIGPVENPGAIQITHNITLMDLLAKVNVQQEKADDILRILHPRREKGMDATGALPIEVNWKKLMEGQTKYNYELTDGDVVVFRWKTDRRVFVLGEVKNPGPVPLKPDMRIMDAIAGAGGPTDAEVEELILIQRPTNFPGENDPGIQRLSFPDVCSGKVGMDIILEDGNTLFIPECDKKLVFVHGYVQKPGAFEWTPRMTIEKAIATAGGLSEFGTWKGVRITRDKGNRHKTMKRVESRADEVLPGDIIYVPETWF